MDSLTVVVGLLADLDLSFLTHPLGVGGFGLWEGHCSKCC